MKNMINRIQSFARGEGGSAMTEFTITLPVFIIIFYGIWDLGFAPMEITNTQAKASLTMWQTSMKLTQPVDLFNNPNSAGDQAAYLSPASGAFKAGEAQAKGRNKHNGHGSVTSPEGIVHAASVSGAGGSANGFDIGIGDAHYVESAYRGGLLSVGMSGVPDFKLKAEDVVGGEDRKYPELVLNDGIFDSPSQLSNGSSGGFMSQVAGVILTALDAAGAMHSVGAGIRYGAVHGEHEGNYSGILGYSVKPKYIYDNLVSPVPLQGDSANIVPMLLARVSAETEEKYAVALRFGKANWGNGGGLNFDMPDVKEDAENSDDVEEAEDCEDDGFSSVDLCRRCRSSSCSDTACPGYDRCSCVNPKPADCS